MGRTIGIFLQKRGVNFRVGDSKKVSSVVDVHFVSHLG
jgi:hypothetical protein